MTTSSPVNPAKEFLPMPLEPLGDEWKPVNYPGVDPAYTVSLYGEVRSPQGKTLKPGLQSSHLWVSMRTKSGTGISARLDRVVLSTFSGHESMMIPEHIDNDPANCQLINLKWRKPTNREAGAMRARASRVKNQTKKKAKVVARTPRTKATKASSVHEITMMRVYELGDVRVAVDAEGALQSLTPDPTRKRWTTEQTMALAEIMLRVAEMNTLMGVGK